MSAWVAAAPELAARTLQIAPEAWRATLETYRARVLPAPANESVDDEISRCLAVLAAAFADHNPHAAPSPVATTLSTCPACGARAVRPFIARSPSMIYGRCGACGHGVLLDGDIDDAARTDAIRARYADVNYYRARAADGAGYDSYDRENAYREAKGARLIERIGAHTPPSRALLEIGSGYGYTRIAAARAGWTTTGVDVNRNACDEAAHRYDLATFCGTLADALATPGSGITRGAFDVVLYQFVLEHVVDPAAELALAHAALKPGGRVALLVPSMEAAEIDAFGAAYRSFRADHLHLYSHASLAATFATAGFAAPTCESHCNLHLLGPFLSPAALNHLYASGRGPDLFVTAERLP